MDHSYIERKMYQSQDHTYAINPRTISPVHIKVKENTVPKTISEEVVVQVPSGKGEAKLIRVTLSQNIDKPKVEKLGRKMVNSVPTKRAALKTRTLLVKKDSTIQLLAKVNPKKKSACLPSVSNASPKKRPKKMAAIVDVKQNHKTRSQKTSVTFNAPKKDSVTQVVKAVSLIVIKNRKKKVLPRESPNTRSTRSSVSKLSPVIIQKQTEDKHRLATRSKSAVIADSILNKRSLKRKSPAATTNETQLKSKEHNISSRGVTKQSRTSHSLNSLKNVERKRENVVFARRSKRLQAQ